MKKLIHEKEGFFFQKEFILFKRIGIVAQNLRWFGKLEGQFYHFSNL